MQQSCNAWTDHPPRPTHPHADTSGAPCGHSALGKDQRRALPVCPPSNRHPPYIHHVHSFAHPTADRLPSAQHALRTVRRLTKSAGSPLGVSNAGSSRSASSTALCRSSPSYLPHKAYGMPHAAVRDNRCLDALAAAGAKRRLHAAFLWP
eukprot:364707-Chlamydomonas_euryale.AAC.28